MIVTANEYINIAINRFNGAVRSESMGTIQIALRLFQARANFAKIRCLTPRLVQKDACQTQISSQDQ